MPLHDDGAPPNITAQNLLQNNIGSLLLAVLFFLSQYVFDESKMAEKESRTQIQKLSITVATLTLQVETLNSTMNAASLNRYTSVDADRDGARYIKLAEQMAKNLQMQIEDARGRISKLESKH